jgi:hypothetical protein
MAIVKGDLANNMEFKITKPSETVVTLSRRIGYRPMGVSSDNEYNLVRPLAGQNYPRFHIYVKKDKDGVFYFNLHLDQKQPSYQGSSAHSGEYEGDLIEQEAERIKRTLEETN